MKKAFKYGGTAIGIIIVLALVLPFLIPTETYKKLVVKEVEKKISGRLEVASMRVKLLPLPGFTLKNVKLSNTTGTFTGQPIIAAKEISGNVKLMPLISKNVIASLRLESPEVYYNTAGNGKTNIDDLLAVPVAAKLALPKIGRASSAATLLISKAWAEDVKQTPTASDWKIMVSGFEINDGLVRITKEGEVPTEIKHLDFKLSDFSPTAEKASAPLYLAAVVLGSEKQNIKLDGRLNLNLKNKSAEIKDWKVVVGSANFKLNAKANYGDQISADLDLTLPNTAIGDILAFDPKLLAQIPKDVSKEALNKTQVSLDLNGNYDKSVINIKKLALTLGGTKLSADGTFSTDKEMPVNLTASISPVKIAELKNLVPALRPIGDIADPNISLKIGGPVSNLKKLNVAGHVASKHVKYQEYEISNLKTDFRYGGDKITLSSLSGSLYGGSLSGSGSLLMANEPAYSADVSITEVDMSKVPATKDLLRGKGTLKVTASGRGTDAVAIKKNLKANGSIRLANGDVPSLKLGEKIFGNSAWNILAKPGIVINQQGLNELRSIDASCRDFNAVFKIDNGVITTPDVKWQHAKYRVALSGSVTMDEQLDYKGDFALSKTTTNALVTNQSAKNILANKAGELAVPFNIGGTVSSPSVRPDEKYLASLFTKAVAELAVGKAKEAVKNVIGSSPKETGKKLLQGLFGK